MAVFHLVNGEANKPVVYWIKIRKNWNLGILIAQLLTV